MHHGLFQRLTEAVSHGQPSDASRPLLLSRVTESESAEEEGQAEDTPARHLVLSGNFSASQRVNMPESFTFSSWHMVKIAVREGGDQEEFFSLPPPPPFLTNQLWPCPSQKIRRHEIGKLISSMGAMGKTVGTAALPETSRQPCPLGLSHSDLGVLVLK